MTLLRDDFCHALRRQASTVAIVTAVKDGQWYGMAATAVTSVAADPPTMLVAVNRRNTLHSIVAQQGRFCINLLAERHAALVAAFGGGAPGDARFEHGSWTVNEDSLPILVDAAANLHCKTVSTLDVSTHTLFIGEVQSVRTHERIDPLLWIDGSVASAAPLPA